MTGNSDDLVRLTAGSLTQVNHWHDLLRGAGIESRVAGDNLSAGLGSALPGFIELWVHRANAGAAGAAIAGQSEEHRWEPELHPAPPQGRPGDI